MTARWWLFVTGLVIGVALTIAGFALTIPGLVVVGFLISIALFFSRKYVE